MKKVDNNHAKGIQIMRTSHHGKHRKCVLERVNLTALDAVEKKKSASEYENGNSETERLTI